MRKLRPPYPFLEETYKKYGLYRQNIAPLVPEFWKRSLDAKPYLYRQPSLLKSKLEQIENSNIDGKEKTILKELSWSLATRPNAEMQEWLRKGTSPESHFDGTRSGGNPRKSCGKSFFGCPLRGGSSNVLHLAIS